MRHLPKIAALGFVFALASCLLPEYSVDESMGGTGGSGGVLPELPPKPDGCGPHNADMVPIRGGYCIDKTEVTWEKYVPWAAEADAKLAIKPKSTLCNIKLVHTPDCAAPLTQELQPVVCVDWCDAVAYCDSVGKRLCGRIEGDSLTLAEFNDTTQSQWMNACSSGGRYRFPYGDTYDADACHANGEGQPALVASQPQCTSPDPLYSGVFDLSGNAAEWEDACNDQGQCRVRGGAFNDKSDGPLACGADRFSPRGTAVNLIGFRCCWDAK